MGCRQVLRFYWRNIRLHFSVFLPLEQVTSWHSLGNGQTRGSNGGFNLLQREARERGRHCWCREAAERAFSDGAELRLHFRLTLQFGVQVDVTAGGCESGRLGSSFFGCLPGE